MTGPAAVPFRGGAKTCWADGYSRRGKTVAPSMQRYTTGREHIPAAVREVEAGSPAPNPGVASSDRT